ncbi:MAG: hypothetical protein V1819_03660 [bacterium]
MEQSKIRRVAIVRVHCDDFEPIKCIVLTSNTTEDNNEIIKTLEKSVAGYKNAKGDRGGYELMEEMKRRRREKFDDFKKRIDEQFSFWMNREIKPPV